MPIAAWDDKLKAEFWDYLHTFVGREQAGWGTWCVREPYGPGTRGRGSEEGGRAEEQRREEEEEEEVVRVYCWGEVVGEIWLLLFIASGRKIKGVGARWVDAGGMAVVVMK